ncbi:hypothetical protein PCANC_24078 [Puccinia coronata f. sp. avenae]|uniref:Uncharacterized protein n=1 Tax=Puccinia coronata f. sp. avenae TaxID=200324 RepID=A0A2N5UHG3_9BASI|nr:hypothetical protein PCANC_24078 [Puccinia coronata f. sp. avenae]
MVVCKMVERFQQGGKLTIFTSNTPASCGRVTDADFRQLMLVYVEPQGKTAKRTCHVASARAAAEAAAGLDLINASQTLVVVMIDAEVFVHPPPNLSNWHLATVM